MESRDSNRSDAWTTKRSRISGPSHPQEGIYPELLPVQSGSSHNTIFPKSLVNKSELGAKTAPKYSSMSRSGLNHANLSNSKWGQYVGDVPLSIDTYGPTTGAHNGKTFSAHETEYQREASFGHSEKKSTSLYPEENHEFTRDSIVFSNVAQKLSQPLPMQTSSKSMPGTVVPSSKWAKFIEPQTKTYESESEDDDSENIPEVSTENDPHREYQDIICDRDSDKRISTNEAGVFFQVDDDLDEVLQDDFWYIYMGSFIGCNCVVASITITLQWDICWSVKMCNIDKYFLQRYDWSFNNEWCKSIEIVISLLNTLMNCLLL